MAGIYKNIFLSDIICFISKIMKYLIDVFED
jgi:hypothetical protein